MSLAELTDVYNTAYKDTYSAEDVYKDVPSLKNIKYRDERFYIPYKDRFEDGEFRKRIQIYVLRKTKKIHL